MREAISAAAQQGVTPAIAFKWLLMHLSPKAARGVLSIRNINDAPRYDQLSWTAGEGTDSKRGRPASISQEQPARTR
jgi:hypothetical protein